MTSNGGSNQGDPGELFAKGLSFINEAIKVFGKEAGEEWGQVTDAVKEKLAPKPRSAAEPDTASDREKLMFALGDRAVTALEDISLNLAAIRQRLERTAED